MCVNFQPYSNLLLLYLSSLAHTLLFTHIQCAVLLAVCWIKNSSTILLLFGLLKFGEYEEVKGVVAIEFHCKFCLHTFFIFEYITTLHVKLQKWVFLFSFFRYHLSLHFHEQNISPPATATRKTSTFLLLTFFYYMCIFFSFIPENLNDENKK